MKKIILFALGLSVLSSCQKSLDSSSHYKNGYCFSETCECIDGYIGDKCQTEVTPTQVIIEKIQVKGLPEFNHGESWDRIGGEPDVFLMVKQKHDVLYQSNDVIEDIRPDQTIRYNSVNLELNDALALYTLKIMDFDGDDEQAQTIHACDFRLFEKDNGFPSELVISEKGIELTLSLAYRF